MSISMGKQGKRLYLVETETHVYYSTRKLDAAYKHVEFRRGFAKYKEVDAGKYQWPSGKTAVSLNDGTLEEVQ